MNRKTLGFFLACVFAVTAFYVPMGARSVHAALITNQEVDRQTEVVLTSVVSLLREDVKLLQMLLIRKLEARIAVLKLQVRNQ